VGWGHGGGSLGAVISRVEEDGLGAEMGLEPGDELLAIDGEKPRDVVHYRYLMAGETVELHVRKKDADTIWVVEVEKDYDTSLGVEFSTPIFDGVKTCTNRCVFCFVDQMPPGLRSSLYLKDDDYRLSFLHGNFVTLSNLTDENLTLIKRMRLSPLYVSVHATDPVVRQRLMRGKKTGDILGQLQFLVDAGIEVHTQVVLCPGLNDGAVLQRTLDDLATLWPGVRSVGVVPVGLTRYRRGLYPVEPVTPRVAKKTLEMVRRRQAGFKEILGSRFVFLGDEFFLFLGEALPSWDAYEGFPQLENGIGLARRIMDEFQALEPNLPRRLAVARRATVVTGRAGEAVLRPLVRRLNQVQGLSVELRVVPNHFFGPTVTVTGLLTGQDVMDTLLLARSGGKKSLGRVLIPAVMLQDERVFLDNITVEELASRIGEPVEVVAATAASLVEAVLGGPGGLGDETTGGHRRPAQCGQIDPVQPLGSKAGFDHR